MGGSTSRHKVNCEASLLPGKAYPSVVCHLLDGGFSLASQHQSSDLGPYDHHILPLNMPAQWYNSLPSDSTSMEPNRNFLCFVNVSLLSNADAVMNTTAPIDELELARVPVYLCGLAWSRTG